MLENQWESRVFSIHNFHRFVFTTLIFKWLKEFQRSKQIFLNFKIICLKYQQTLTNAIRVVSESIGSNSAKLDQYRFEVSAKQVQKAQKLRLA